MAGMFYSLKEAAQKLGIGEDQVKQLAKDGKLREFRDGSNLLFKIEEVNALLAEGVDVGADELELPAEEPAAESPEDTAAALGESVEDDIFKLDEEAAPAAEAEGSEASDLDLIPELEDSQAAETEPEAAEETPGLELEQPEAPESTAEEDLLLAEGLAEPAAEEPEQPILEEAEGATATGSSEEISLAQESGVLAEGSDISDMDTALTGEGVNVLGETDTDYDVTEDSMAETAGPAASAETGAEPSLEEIEDDVNLDSFGSGSGLLDLSLQADDTSLGGILDEIYTSEGGEGEATPADGAPAEAEAGEGPAFEDMTAEAEHAPEEEAGVPEPVAVMPAAMVPAYAEALPDAQSNILGMLLFLPMLALLYTAIVVVAAMKNVMPTILTSVQGLIPYIMGGGIVLALVVFGASFAAGREKAPKAAKPAKDKKAKAEKSKKEKAAVAEGAAKPGKEKKGFSLFGKKKEKK
jgi:excisionase family DNA binding protein